MMNKKFNELNVSSSNIHEGQILWSLLSVLSIYIQDYLFIHYMIYIKINKLLRNSVIYHKMIEWRNPKQQFK